MITNSSDSEQGRDRTKYAQTNGSLDIASFKACAPMPKNTRPKSKRVRRTLATVGISATPSFVIGKTTKDSLDGDRVVGAVPASVFETEIQKFITAR
jgi:protein-disulfide isomerase